MRTSRLALLMLPVLVLSSAPLHADDKDLDVKETIRLGLEWVAREQIVDDSGGHWEANGGQYPTTMTALAGMVLLMEGSTMKEGKYSEQISKAVDWFLKRPQANGLLGNPNNPTESSRYMYGHGFGLLFLSCVYGEEDRPQRRRELEKVLRNAVKFCINSQTDRGGWGYVSAKEGGNFDEGSVTITQLQALRAARNAGITVEKEVIDKAIKYLKDCTTQRGGIIYSLTHGAPAVGGERPPLTVAAVACSFNAGDYGSEYGKKWLKYCREYIPIQRGRVSHDEYQNYYYAQALYVLGDDRYAKLFPESRNNKADQLTWSEYKKVMFPYIKETQQRSQPGAKSYGSWTGGYIGPIYTTCVNLTILQLENNTLPIYQR